MICYLSGYGHQVDPEQVLGRDSDVMITYADMHKKNVPNKRFQAILDDQEAKEDEHDQS